MEAIISRSEDEATETQAEGRARKGAPRQPKPRRPAPKVIADRFEVSDELGAGGMGVVYRARDRQLGRDVAVKLVHTDDDPDETLAARLMREAQALAQLSHPNVVAVYDVGRTEGGVFVAMELVAGEAGDFWLQKPRPWQEVVRVFRDAARGLAAAHAVGLVHRDFKPANLMIGSDGRVRVLDFGLARAAGFGTPVHDSGELVESDERETRKLESGELDPAVSAPGLRSPSLLDVALTRDGAVVGTPQYMAPEQFVGAAYDARTDQFSFCVALYKALYGVRPFEGKTFGELKQNVVHGRMRTPPDGVDVPAWVREVAVRGLSVDPAKRWPSMDAIIEILARDPGARRRRIALAAAAVVLVGGGAVAAYAMARRDPSAVCRGSERELAGVWDGSARGAVKTAFDKTGKPFAADALNAATHNLDDYTHKWVAMRGEACEATRVHGTQSEALLDLRMACLQRRLHDVRATVDVLEAADGDVVTRAGELTAELPPLAACGDVDALRAPVPRPHDAKTAARVDAALRALAVVRAQLDAGHYAAAQQKLAPLLGEAKELGWRPLEGEVLLAAAQVADATGQYPDAAKLFKDAAVAAEAGRDDELAALARNGLVWVIGERLGKYDEAQELSRDAEAKVERLGHPDAVRADLDQKMSALLVEQGKYAEAEKRSQRVLEIRQKTLQPDDARIASALGDLGDIDTELARPDEAIAYYRRALPIADKAVDPTVGASLRINLASALRMKGATGDALEELDKARTLTERALGPDHPQLATIALDTGAAELDAGRAAEALAQFQRAREIFTTALGADHPNVGSAEFRIGEVALAQGRPDDALASFQHAFDIWKAKLGADHPTLATALDGLARAELARKHPAQALTYYQRALAMLEKSMGPNDAVVASPLMGIGTAELALGKPQLAVAPLERAVAIDEKAEDPAETARARAELEKARALAKR